jgi:hypothetical protein
MTDQEIQNIAQAIFLHIVDANLTPIESSKLIAHILAFATFAGALDESSDDAIDGVSLCAKQAHAALQREFLKVGLQ